MKHTIVIPVLIVVGILGTGLVLSLMFFPHDNSNMNSENPENSQALATPEIENEGEVQGSTNEYQENVVEDEGFNIEESLRETSDPEDGIIDRFEIQDGHTEKSFGNDTEEIDDTDEDSAGFAK